MPVSIFSLQAQLLSSLFRFRESQKKMHRIENIDALKEEMFVTEDVMEKNLLEHIKIDFQNTRPIEKLNFFRTMLTCRSKYKKMLVKSQSTLEKELDLRKFIYR